MWTLDDDQCLEPGQITAELTDLMLETLPEKDSEGPDYFIMSNIYIVFYKL